MSTLARFAGPLALLAGTVWVIATLIQAVAPLSYAWIGLIASAPLIGGAALGLQQQFGARTGRLGRWGAAATEAGFANRVMFGSDHMVWPGAIGYAIESIEAAEFLTENQRRAILYDNAARFLRLTEEDIARHHRSE